MEGNISDKEFVKSNLLISETPKTEETATPKPTRAQPRTPLPPNKPVTLEQQKARESERSVEVGEWEMPPKGLITMIHMSKSETRPPVRYDEKEMSLKHQVWRKKYFSQ